MINIPSTAAPAVSRTRLPPTSVRERKIRSGTNGAMERPSIWTKSAISTTEASTGPIVRASVHPLLGASETA